MVGHGVPCARGRHGQRARSRPKSRGIRSSARTTQTCSSPQAWSSPEYLRSTWRIDDDGRDLDGVVGEVGLVAVSCSLHGPQRLAMTCASLIDSATMAACCGASLLVVLERCNGDPARVRAMGWKRFAAAVRRELPRWGTTRWFSAIVRSVFDATTDTTGVAVRRIGALERALLVLEDWHTTRARLHETEARMVAVLDDLDLVDLVTSIRGLSTVGAAQILAECGDANRFDSPRSMVKHAGLCPRENNSGNHTGTSRLAGAGRPGLRLAAWRAVWGAIHANPVYAARFTHLTRRPDNPLSPGQARAAIAAALLRQLHVVLTRRVAWDPTIAGAPAPAALAA